MTPTGSDDNDGHGRCPSHDGHDAGDDDGRDDNDDGDDDNDEDHNDG